MRIQGLSMIRAYKILIFFITISLMHANNVNITEKLPFIDIDIDGKTVRIERIQDTKHKLKNSFSKTSRPSPLYSIQKFQPNKGIETIGELEVIDALGKLANNQILLIDVRIVTDETEETIPGSIRIPFPYLLKKNKSTAMIEILELFGAKKLNNLWDFKKSKMLLFFDNGPWCTKATQVIKNLILCGYPKNKIRYYRGGMQYWHILGLKTSKI